MEADRRGLLEEYLDKLAVIEPVGPDGTSFTRTMRTLLDSPEAARQAIRRIYSDTADPHPIPQAVIQFWAAYFGDDELVLDIALDVKALQGTLPNNIWWPLFRGMRRLAGFKVLVRDTGLVDYWRSSGNWGEFCRPLGHADFECD